VVYVAEKLQKKDKNLATRGFQAEEKDKEKRG